MFFLASDLSVSQLLSSQRRCSNLLSFSINAPIHIVHFFRVLNIQYKEKSKPRPGALNTVEMLRVSSASLGIGPQQTMQIAEKLYTQVFHFFQLQLILHFGCAPFGLFPYLNLEQSKLWRLPIPKVSDSIGQ